MNSTACSPKIIIPNLYNRHHHPIAPSAQYTTIGENRRRAVSLVSTGLPSPPIVHHHRFAPTAQCKKTAEERFNMLARGWLAYPVTPTHLPSTAEERLYKRHPGMRQRRITPRNPIRTTWRDTISMRFGDALLPPLGAMHRHREKTAIHRLAYP